MGFAIAAIPIKNCWNFRRRPFPVFLFQFLVESGFYMLKTGLALTGANILIALLGLARNILIARLIGVEDFGIASTFAITAAFIEMTSNVGIDRMVVQAKDGEEPALQATAHAIQAIRGIVGALVLLGIAGPLAHFFGVPNLTWAYQTMALVPLLRGFVHLDMFRFQRRMKFRASAGTELSAIFVSTLAAIPAAIYIADYRVMLLAIILQQIFYLIGSHLVAQRKYALGLDRQILNRLFHFGWPLLFNNVLMYGILNGDRIIVANQIGIKELGWFSAAFILTLSPALVLSRSIASYFLPILSKEKSGQYYDYSANVVFQLSIFISIVFVNIFYFFGGIALVLLYGDDYSTGSELVAMLALMQAVRLARQAPSVIALSMGDTFNSLAANIMRSLFLPIALLMAIWTKDIYLIIAIGILGEIAALVTSYVIVKKRNYMKENRSLLSITLVVSAFIILSLITLIQYQIYSYILYALVFLLFAFAITSMKDLMFWVKSLSWKARS
jgi:O-antigen/teichoic acid export membrane protein